MIDKYELESIMYFFFRYCHELFKDLTGKHYYEASTFHKTIYNNGISPLIKVFF